MYSTGNTTQHSIMTYMGKESKKVPICTTDSLCHTAGSNTIVNHLYFNNNNNNKSPWLSKWRTVRDKHSFVKVVQGQHLPGAGGR